jgi:hypothetical protein
MTKELKNIIISCNENKIETHTLREIMTLKTTLPYNYNSKNNSYTTIAQLSLGIIIIV